MVVALVGPSDDRQTNAVATALDARDTEWVIWDSDQWPGERPLSFEITSGTRTTVGDPVVLDELSAVYFRRIGFDPRGPEFEGVLEDRPYSLVNQLREYRGLMMSVLQYLEGRSSKIEDFWYPTNACVCEDSSERALTANTVTIVTTDSIRTHPDNG